MVATAVAIAASIAQIAWFKWKGKISPVHWLSLAIIVVFGGATLILKDDLFIKWKPTVLYACFGLILASGKLIFGRDLIGYVLKDITLPPAIWSRVTWSWVVFFAAMGALNWYIAFHFSTDTWVNFKVFGGIGLFVLFAVAQVLMLARYVTEPQKP
jgi:intracellular septation protein